MQHEPKLSPSILKRIIFWIIWVVYNKGTLKKLIYSDRFDDIRALEIKEIQEEEFYINNLKKQREKVNHFWIFEGKNSEEISFKDGKFQAGIGKKGKILLRNREGKQEIKAIFWEIQPIEINDGRNSRKSLNNSFFFLKRGKKNFYWKYIVIFEINFMTFSLSCLFSSIEKSEYYLLFLWMIIII